MAFLERRSSLAWFVLPAGLLTAGLLTAACGPVGASQPEPSTPSPTAETPAPDSEPAEPPAASARSGAEDLPQKTPETAPMESSVGSFPIVALYKKNLAEAPSTFEDLIRPLPAPGPEYTPSFSVKQARFSGLVTGHRGLTSAQERQLMSQGFIAVSTPSTRSMGEAYRDLWESDLPVLITTDSILHAWHRTYDVTLEELELTEFADSYLALMVKMRSALESLESEIPQALLPQAKKVDVYLSVALSFLEHMSKDGYVVREGGNWEQEKPPVMAPVFAEEADVQAIIDAIYAGQRRKVPHFGVVDFTQFKVRGHYTKGQGLAQYFRAVLWMGRADTGFRLVSPSGVTSLEGAKSTGLFSLLANRADSFSRYLKTQEAIDYFVGRSNGLSLPAAAAVVDRQKLRLEDLVDDAKLQTLAKELILAAGPDVLTSQAIFTEGQDTPPPLVFQVSSQRFVLDSYVHDQTSFDSVPRRFMVDALDVPAALGSATATRLLESEMEAYPMARQLGSLQKTIKELPPEYWTQDIYTRWLDALRSLNSRPEGSHAPRLFQSEVWERKQLQTQLASWAELRRDTILYAAQAYGSVMCEFPAAYVEPYPEFYDRMQDMARHAATRLPRSQVFRRFAEIMGRLAKISRDELSGKARSKEDTRFLKSVVKQHTVDNICAITTEWTGWYKELFADGNPFKFEPVVADVYTDPNSGRALNVGTTPVQLALVALETPSGPTFFVGPISGFRQFAGPRTNDQEWKDRIKRNQLPPAPAWTHDFQGGVAQSPQKHAPRPDSEIAKEREAILNGKRSKNRP